MQYVQAWGFDMRSHLAKVTAKCNLNRYNAIKETVTEKWKEICYSREINIKIRKYYRLKTIDEQLAYDIQMPLLDVIDLINNEIIIITDVHEYRLWHQYSPAKKDNHHVGGCEECGKIMYHYNAGDVGLCFENREFWSNHKFTNDVNSVTCGRCMGMHIFKEAYRDNMNRYNGCCDTAFCGDKL